MAWLVVAVTFACTFAWAVHGIPMRLPAWGEVEVWFEADRLRAHLPLYIDANTGARDYGPVPAHYFVTYPPLLSHAASVLPPARRGGILRVVASALFLVALAWPALRGAPSKNAYRREAILFAIYFGGFWTLANLLTTGRPDAFAVVLASAALVRTLQREQLDNVASALFVLAAFMKPTVIGLAGAVFVAEITRHRIAVAKRVVGGVVVALVVGGALLAESHGTLLRHVVSANSQGFKASQWFQNADRLVFFGPPCSVAFVAARRAGGARGRLAMAAIGGSFVWTCFALGKIGSASNYWLEPVVATIATVAWFGSAIDWTRAVHGVLACAHVFYVGIAAQKSALERIVADAHEAEFVEGVRRRCKPDEHHVVLSDHAGVEYLANGRVVTTAFQLVHASQRGLIRPGLWADLLRDPNVTCFVAETDLISTTPGAEEILSRAFVVHDEVGRFRLLRKKGSY